MKPTTKRERPTSNTPTERSNTPTKNLEDDTSRRARQREYQRKRLRHDDYNTHQFLDASATVHAGLFGARRLPEIKSLWRSLVLTEISSADEAVRRVGEPGGGKVSSRHLRRRTGSHRPQRRHRYPRGDYGMGTSKDDDRDSSDSRFDGESMAMPEDTLLKSNDSSTLKKPSDVPQINTAKNATKANVPCRRARRKPALLRSTHSTWWKPSHPFPTKQEPHDIDQTQTNNRWTPTHQWHAKRFHMSNSLFSWSIPLIHSNRGCRASLRLAGDKCTLQDATWEVDGCALVMMVRSESEGSHASAIDVVTSLLKRICGADAAFLNREEILDGTMIGEGLIYEVDAFPMRPVGPACFLYRCGDNKSMNVASVSIMVHPSISPDVYSLLETIVAIDMGGFAASITRVPVSLLRIRGKLSMSVMTEVLSLNSETFIEMCKIGVDQSDIEVASDELLLRHGSFFEFNAALLSCETSASNRNQRQTPSDGMKVDHIISETNPNKILVKSHQPNGHHLHLKQLPHNAACSGWDILCHPSIASELFHSFVMKGACAIGLAEDTRAQLEACPPLPIFPRDYPDTKEGRAYWEESCSDDGPTGTRNDWAVIRTCIEASWGRMNTSLRRVRKLHERSKHGKGEKINGRAKVNDEGSSAQDCVIEQTEVFGKETNIIRWSSLIPSSQRVQSYGSSLSGHHSVVVVRGAFGVPFLQILHGFGKFHSSRSERSKKHKHRRPYRSIINASPLSQSESVAHSSLCQQLLQSLSLPALLRCEIFCDGKGTLDPGDLLFPLTCIGDSSDEISNQNVEDDALKVAPLGVVVAGGFSPSRGKCYGVGFLGASRFIEVLLNGTADGMGMKTSHLNMSPKMMLKVKLRKLQEDCVCRHALISLLL
ncbi:hypothetical protein HJC23_004012 [Cyclotella cryptica]|uniref:Uncharacterized protein n=1 Tax=Cyclotella cryptica TaxID=29204 RepID=A0ABD3R036_9STRA|eukprot:CCRYP_002005-RA/>CCRYP_002005-RA protein AED:0.00 eAED:0.00 QI:0/-1/0/1/-1/1/1/0/881